MHDLIMWLPHVLACVGDSSSVRVLASSCSPQCPLRHCQIGKPARPQTINNDFQQEAKYNTLLAVCGGKTHTQPEQRHLLTRVVRSKPF